LLESQNKKLEFYLYPGSLTTPACDETVYHFLITEPFDISTT